MITFDTSLLLNYYKARTNAALGGAATLGQTVNGKTQYAPTAPWSSSSPAPQASDLVKKVTAGQRFINEGANQLDLPGASDDYRKLFALYQGLNALSGVASRWNEKGVSQTEQDRLASVFTKGLAEVNSYADGLKLDQLRLTRGEVLDSLKGSVGVPKNPTTYLTQTLHTGTSSTEVEAFKGAAQFKISVTAKKITTAIDIDLADMGSTPRTMGNVANFINGKLEDAGFRTRFAVERTPAAPRTVTVGGKDVTMPAVGDAFAFKVKGDSAEGLNFSAVQTNPAVYVVAQGGDPDPDDDEDTDDAVYETKLTKFDSATGSKAFTEALEKGVSAVRATKTGPDGSVYMLADVDGTVDGQIVKGKDVALMKYDSAGQLLYTRTLGAAGEASGLSLAVSSDGKVAIAGAIKGQLDGVTEGPLNSADTSDKTDSFTTLFDSEGDEVWTIRRGAIQDDEATAVAFDASGNVLVAGRTKSALPGGGAVQGNWDSYLTSYAADTKGTPKALFTKTFGTTGNDGVSGMVVDGSNVYLAGSENGHGVVRSFAVSGATATAGATRDLGSLQGGAVAGLALEGGKLYIGGNTHNEALAVGGPAGAAGGGGMDAFAASFSTDLTDLTADSLAYSGGAGNDTVTAMAVSGGKVWLTGVSGEPPSVKGGQDGHLTQIDMSTRQVVSTQKLSGKDGYVAPTALAVDGTGSSVLDRFGLPKGTLDYTVSQKVVSATSARPGDQIQIRTSDGRSLKTITLAADDTLESLAAKIRRAAGFRAKVEVVSDGDVRKLKLSPTTDTSTVEVLAGKNGQDLLQALGLSEGIVRKTMVNDDGKTVPADGKAKIYGLKLGADLNLNDEASVKRTLAELGTALSAVKTVYRDLETAAKPKSKTTTAAAAGASGPVPAYLTNQIANYQAALNRLTGSS